MFEGDRPWKQHIIFFMDMLVHVLLKGLQGIEHRPIGIASPVWRCEMVGQLAQLGEGSPSFLVFQFHLLNGISQPPAVKHGHSIAGL